MNKDRKASSKLDLRRLSIREIVWITGGLSALTSCAGPATPLGAIWAVTPSQARQSFALSQSEGGFIPDFGRNPSIRFSPTRQVLHGPAKMRVIVDDPGGEFDEHRLLVRYNGLDVSHAFLQRAQVRIDPRRNRMIVEHPLIKLGANTDHQIEVAYQNANGAFVHARYESPSCYAFRNSVVRNVGTFTPSPSLVHQIEKSALTQGFNPAFAIGLVAQESGFNPRAVSWARALGLTQVTPIAESEVVREFADWPRYPGLNEMPYPMVKAMLLTGQINSSNEWRLNREKSVLGGLEYAKIIARRWSTPENIARIRALFADPERAHTELILASYNSGYARVSGALERLGKNWIRDPDLQEARKYVNRIFSYCQAFSEKEAELENAT